MGKRFYWLKLKKDFFKRHDIRILEGLENGHEIVLFYLKLLCESIDHDGALRFSEDVPYTEDMLAAVTGTCIEVAKKAMKALKDLELVVALDDGTFVMPKAAEMVGSAADNDNANRQRRWREKQPAGVTQALQNVTDSVTKNNATVTDTVTKNNESKSKSKSKSKRLELDIDKKGKSGATPPRTPRAFLKPTVEEVMEYCKERGNGIDAAAFVDFYEAKGWRVGNQPMKDWRACVRTWEARRKAGPPAGIPPPPAAVPYMQKEYNAEEQKLKEQKDLDELLNMED